MGDERVIMPIPDPVDDPHMWKHRCHVSVRGSRAYIGAESELVIIEMADAHALRETGRHTLESFRPQSYYDPKLVATDGDKLYVERFWPHELVEFDITHPDQPREVEYLPLSWSDDIQSLLIVDGVAYGDMLEQPRRGRSLDYKVQEWKIAEYGALIESLIWGLPERLGDRSSLNALSAANGYLYATRGGALLAYRLD